MYTKVLNQFQSKINELKNLTLDQDQFNSLISQLISSMNLDENIVVSPQNQCDTSSFLRHIASLCSI